MKLERSDVPPEFIDLFVKTIGIRDEDFEIVLSHYSKQYLPAKYFFLREGEVSDRGAYVSKGCARNFTIDSNGGEHTHHFAFEGWVLGSLESVYCGTPSSFNIQALENCELLCFTKKSIDELEARFRKYKEWHIEKQRKAHHAVITRLLEVKTLSVEERYLKLIEKHPHIFQRISLQHIASFLDIEPPSLSRLRKRLHSR
ncbi:MAG: Crp/Fnr family transcriptional regulator [Taibaiella sp.]|nr:Crp/Fnr family transcriptional regulator [Taibaiella sp.]